MTSECGVSSIQEIIGSVVLNHFEGFGQKKRNRKGDGRHFAGVCAGKNYGNREDRLYTVQEFSA